MIESILPHLLPLEFEQSANQDLRPAAVLMPLLFNQPQQRWEILLTRRAEHLKHHPGQISFPGGRFEIEDINLQNTATRETYEEIGIRPEQIELIGRLPQQQTVSQYEITPYVGIIDTNYQLAIDHNEVAEVFTVPFDYVTDQTNQKRVQETIKGHRYEFYVIQYRHYNIWGATAKILVNFTRRIHRVSDSTEFS